MAGCPVMGLKRDSAFNNLMNEFHSVLPSCKNTQIELNQCRKSLVEGKRRGHCRDQAMALIECSDNQKLASKNVLKACSDTTSIMVLR